jgi:hypothetical protein
MIGARAGGDDDVSARSASLGAVRAQHVDLIARRRSGPAEHHLDPVALVVAVAGAHLMVDDRVRRPQQVRELDVHLVQSVVEQRVAPIVRQHLDGVAQRLARDGAPMGAAAAHLVVGLDDGHLAPALASFMAAPSPAGPDADDDAVERAYCHGVTRVTTARRPDQEPDHRGLQRLQTLAGACRGARAAVAAEPPFPEALAAL